MVTSLYLWFVLTMHLATYSESDHHHEETIWDIIIPEQYDKFAAPVVNDKPVIVYVNLQIMDVDEIREGTMDFRMHLYLTDMWKDPRLKFHLINITRPKIFPYENSIKIWIPDLVFDNSKWGQLFQFSLPNAVIKINNEFLISRIARYSFQVSCPMNLRDYPMDIQHCGFKIAFLANSEDTATLYWSGEPDSPYEELGPSIILTEDIQPLKYQMKLPTPYRLTESWVDGNFTYLIANFTFVRRLTGNIINIYVPSSIIVSLSWLSFWLDVNAVPARVTLGVTSLLTLITQIVQARSYMPPINYIKALDIWLFVCISLVTASLVEYGIAYQFRNKSSEKPKPAAVPVPKTKTLVKVKPLIKPGECSEEITCQKRGLKSPLTLSGYYEEVAKGIRWFQPNEQNNYFDFYSRLLFPALFISFVLGYWLYYLNRRAAIEQEGHQ